MNAVQGLVLRTALHGVEVDYFKAASLFQRDVNVDDAEFIMRLG